MEMLQVEGSTGQGMWHLHPPFLRALGMKKKLRIPYKVASPLMRILSKGKILRGTPFDVFGYAEVRKVERQIRDLYRTAVVDALGTLTQDNYGDVLALAALAMDVRGYEDIKLRSAANFLKSLSSFPNVSLNKA